MDWRDKAACKDLHIELFYPPVELKDPFPYYNISKHVCYVCPVWEYCIEDALKNDEKWGCWGGTTPQDRRHPTKVPHGTPERFRLGCSCDNCFDAEANKPKIDIRNIPKNGQYLDIPELLFKLSNSK